MTDSEFDVIVVGGGLAGLCCAGELIVQGARPLLICESKEVGAVYKSPVVGGKPTIMHHPSRAVAWGGGWWFGLTRRLNVPIRMFPSHCGARVTIQGSGVIQNIPIANSAATLTDATGRMLPIPIDDFRDGIERVFYAALAIPYEELAGMHRISMGQWLEDQKADEPTTMLMLALGGCFSYLESDVVRDQLSAYACLGMIRAYLCGESELWAIEPNARDGLCIPIARAIEQQGGAVWRGRRATKVITEGRQGGTVILEDGTEVGAPAIAMAGGNHRMGALLDVLPPAVEECLRYEAEESPVPQLEEFAIFARLDKPVDVEPRMFSFIVSPDLTSLHATWSTDAVAPWTVDPGTYCLVTETVLTPDQIAQRGGRDAVFAAMPDATEELHPGYKDAVFAEVNTRYPTWQTPFTCGPKMPRTVEDVRGLYFVGEGSAPTCGLYMEGSASAGILGARTIAADRTA